MLSSRGPQLTIASTVICRGFVSLVMWIWQGGLRVSGRLFHSCIFVQSGGVPVSCAKRTISNAWATMRTAMSFLPLFRPFIMRELVRRSTIGHCALRKRLTT